MFGVIALLVLLMALRMRRLMKRDDEQLVELEQAHVELKAKEAQAHHLAYHDVLTGLPNRALFNDNADKAATRARHGEKIAIVLLDLDRLRTSTTASAISRDALIQEVGRRISRVLAVPFRGRLGATIRDPARRRHEDASKVSSPILDALHRPYEISATTHVGSAVPRHAPDSGSDPHRADAQAESRLSRQDEGRDCYRFSRVEDDRPLRALLEEDLRAAISTGTGLSVHYQPLVDSKGGKVSGLEALLRWHHPSRGWIPPHLFVPVAEETGLICALGDWVLGEACKVANEWPNLSIAVNLSPIQFCDEGFANRTCAPFARPGCARTRRVRGHRSVVLDQNEGSADTARLRCEASASRWTIRTGYSSLSYLRDFEVDRIKIDRSFVQGLGQTVDAGAIVTAVVTLGHAMGLQVTAEGVETADQEDFLRGAGCNVLQGFLFSRAVPAHQLRGSLGGRREVKAA